MISVFLFGTRDGGKYQKIPFKFHSHLFCDPPSPTGNVQDQSVFRTPTEVFRQKVHCQCRGSVAHQSEILFVKHMSLFKPGAVSVCMV